MNADIATLLEFLVPDKTPHSLENLIFKIGNNYFNWEEILFQANLNLCTPLWYVQLKKDNLLRYLPDDLSEYLSYIYELNLERNNQFQSGLEEILEIFTEHKIESVLLKGAATFCDDLFIPGSRFMGDLDILVPVEKVLLSQSLIASLGYEPMPDEEVSPDSMPSDIRQHHIARYVKTGTPIVVEIHFGISRGQAGRVFDLNEVWSQSIVVEFRGYNTSILNPKHRILLNTVHAMLPLREYLSGHISALQWVEFVLLVERYSTSFQWSQWFSVAEKNGFENLFKLYYYFAVHFLQMSDDGHVAIKGSYIKFNVNRLCIISQYQNKNIRPDVLKKTTLNFFKLGYYIGLIEWLWNNQCYTEEMTGSFERFRFCLSRLFSKESRKAYWL